MFGISFAHIGEKIVAVADVGSDSVGVCIIRVQKDGHATALAWHEATLPFEERSIEQKIAGVLSLLNDTCEKSLALYAETEMGKRVRSISSAYAIIRAPWANSKAWRSAISFEKEEYITDDIIGNLVRVGISEDKEVDHSKLFEAAVVRFELNGYPTRVPAGKWARTVAVMDLFSECDVAMSSKIAEILQRVFSVKSCILRSETRALLSVLNDDLVRSRNHIVIMMSGDCTNCIVIRHDVAAEHVVVPEGSRTIIKKVAGDGMSEEVLSLLRMTARDTCSTPACEKLNASLSRIEPELVKMFGDVFGSLASVIRLPNDLILIAEADIIPWMAQFFSRIDFGQFTATTRPFVPRVLTKEEMRKIIIFETGRSIGAGLVVAAGFVNNEEQ